MEKEQIKLLQQAILNQIYFSESVFDDFQTTQSVIPPEVFGRYQ
jgi:hypothetical protein